MRETLTRFLVFSGVSVGACLATVGSIGFTLDGLSKAAIEVPAVHRPLKPSYIAVMPVAKADSLNIAKSTAVAFRAPVSVVVPKGPTTLVTEAPAFTHTVGVESLRVRQGPRKTASQLFALKGGTPVIVSRAERGWVLITDEIGRSGWVYGQLLNPAEKLVAAN